MSPSNDYWFRAKRHGWGWGLPRCWQGWATLLGYIGLVAADAAIFPPPHQPLEFGLLLILLSLVLVAVCWLKGEPVH